MWSVWHRALGTLIVWVPFAAPGTTTTLAGSGEEGRAVAWYLETFVGRVPDKHLWPVRRRGAMSSFL